MAVRLKHNNEYTIYFCTFTCYGWLHLFQLTNSYDAVFKWFHYLSSNDIQIIAYVIMPNHIHVLVYFPTPGYDLNKIIANAKRFLAYEIVKRLKLQNADELLAMLASEVSEREKKKGQVHKVFEESFDAKPVYSESFFQQKISYIHYNPVSGKWQLVNDYTDYEFSSASFYETGVAKHYKPYDFRTI